MDPLSITVSSLALLSTVAKSSFAITDFVRRYQAAAGDLGDVKQELSELRTTLELLQSIIGDSEESALPQSLKTHVVSIIKRCEDSLKRLDGALGKHKGTFTAARWVLDGKREVTDLRHNLEAYRGTLSVLLETATLYVIPPRELNRATS